MQATDDCSRASQIRLRRRVLLPVVAHCVLFVCLFFSKVIDLLVSPLNLFLVLVFVLRVFSDWCCDNYKEGCATGIPVDWNDSHRAIVLLLG